MGGSSVRRSRCSPVACGRHGGLAGLGDRYSVGEVGCLWGQGLVVGRDLDLAGKDLLPHLFAVLPGVGAFAD